MKNKIKVIKIIILMILLTTVTTATFMGALDGFTWTTEEDFIYRAPTYPNNAAVELLDRVFTSRAYAKETIFTKVCEENK